MDLKEFTEQISNSPSYQWFQDVEETFNFPYAEYSNTIKGAAAIYGYVLHQLAGWDAIETPLPKELMQSKSYFEGVRQQLEGFVTAFAAEGKVTTLNQLWNQRVKNHIAAVHTKPLPYELPNVQFLVELYAKSPAYFPGAHQLMVNDAVTINKGESFVGAMLAAEFVAKDTRDVSERIDKEKKSIEALRSRLKNHVDETTGYVQEKVKKLNDDFVLNSDRINQLEMQKGKAFDDWFGTTKTDTWERWFGSTKTELEGLVRAYGENLRLSEPAKYWSDRADKLKRQGWWCFGALIALSILVCASLWNILATAPSEIFESWFDEDKSKAIRWSVVYITLITFFAYCIRTVAKVMFSSFHLSRDCEERHTLTAFYLSLIKDSSVSESERQLIMQSLFSRADTGLLKDDSSPTMPASEVINRIVSK